MRNLTIIFYTKPDGSEPVTEFLLSLDLKMRAKTIRTIELLQNNGTELREPYSKALDDGLFELRTKVGSNITRVLYFFVCGGNAILTNGFVKKSDKTPNAEKELAQRYREDYHTRKETP